QSKTSTVWTFSCYVRRADGKPVTNVGYVYLYLYSAESGKRLDSNKGPTAIVDCGDGWYRVIRTDTVSEPAYVDLVGFSALDGTTDWYFDGWQLEAKPFATSFVAGTRAAGVLQYSASGIINPDAGTIAFWYRPEFDLSLIQDQSTSPKLIQVGNYYTNGSFTLWHYSNPGRLSLYVRGQDATGWTAHGTVYQSDTGFARGKWSYVAVTWDGLNWAVYVDGRRVLSITSSQPLGRIDGDIWQFAHGSPKYSQLFDELLILPYAASPEEIRAWYELGAPFYDASENVGIDTPEGHVIEIDRRGIIITPAGFPQRGSHLDGRMLGFWDINNVPSIGLGDVRSMAAQLGSNMEYGILMNQGEIRANESVMSIALTNKGVTSDKIEDGSVTFPKLAPLAVALPGKGHVLIYSTQGRRM